MTGLLGQRRSRRSLQTRLALYYAAGVFAAGVVVLAVVTLPAVGIGSTVPAFSEGTGPITGTETGIGPRPLLIGSAAGVVVLIPVALAAGWFVAGRFLRPLQAITVTARAISPGSLSQRLDLGEPADELTELGHVLDDLFARLEASFDAQRHFVANASHELRTPLAGQRTLLEVTLADPDADAATLRATCQEVLELGGHQERLVQALLDLASSERGLTRRDSLDLAPVVDLVLHSRQDQATQRGIDVIGELSPAETVGDPRLIDSLIANLVDNAIRHNHPGGTVEITTERSGTHATLTVTNSGPFIPDDQIQRLSQPFQRMAPERRSRDGHGLGLAIVTAVARAHDAALTISARPEGGLSVNVRFTDAPGSRPGTSA